MSKVVSRPTQTGRRPSYIVYVVLLLNGRRGIIFVRDNSCDIYSSERKKCRNRSTNQDDRDSTLVVLVHSVMMAPMDGWIDR